MDRMGPSAGYASVEQQNALEKINEYFKASFLEGTVAICGPVGTGKSSLLGLAAAQGIKEGLRNVFVTAREPTSAFEVFRQAQRALEGLGYREEEDFTLVELDATASGEADYIIEETIRSIKGRAIVQLVLGRNSADRLRQSIQFVFPTELKSLIKPDLLLVDEASALPASLVSSMLGPYLTVLSCSTSGLNSPSEYKASELLDMIEPLAALAVRRNTGLAPFLEITLVEPAGKVHYPPVDCAKAQPLPRLDPWPPAPSCALYAVDTQKLKSARGGARDILLRISSLLALTKPILTQTELSTILSPEWDLFILTPPLDSDSPESVHPFAVLASRYDKTTGIITHMAVHPAVRRQGYGRQCVRQWLEYVQRGSSKDKSVATALLVNVEKKSMGRIVDYVSVSQGLSPGSFRFWAELGFSLVTCCTKPDLLTFEYVGIYARVLESRRKLEQSRSQLDTQLLNLIDDWPILLSGPFRSMDARLAATVTAELVERASQLKSSNAGLNERRVSVLWDYSHSLPQLRVLFDSFDLERLGRHIKLPMEPSLIGDLWPLIALVFTRGLCKKLDPSDDNVTVPQLVLGPFQQAALIGFGLQHKSASALAKELGIRKDQLGIQFRICVKRCHAYLDGIRTARAAKHVSEEMERVAAGLRVGLTVPTIAQELSRDR